MHALFLFLLFSFSSLSQSFQPPPGVCPSCFFPPTENQSIDYGRIVINSPSSVFKPKSPEDISLLLKVISNSSAYANVTVAPNGARHSTRGQAQAPAGIVVEMTSLPRSIKIDEANRFVDVDGGALWVEVLEETLKSGLTPRSWTDYLYLTVGGTLSVAGVSGQAFKYGPQIANVLEMDVVTGNGDIITCSMQKNPELFYGVLGGLGQFGIITRARIILEAAPKRVKWVKIPYDDFDKFSNDEEQLIGMPEPDYVEGSIGTAPATSKVSYTIELAFYYNQGDTVQQRIDRVVSRLRLGPGSNGTSDVSYFDFLNRVGAEELKQRSEGQWEEVPHPWLNIFVPKSNIGKFKDLLMETISATPFQGLILIYPFFTYKWNSKMSAVLPEDRTDTLYLVGVLRSAPASCTPGTQCIEALLSLNQKIIDAAVTGGMGAKEYLAYWKDEEEWSVHFGEKWEGFKGLKDKYDPLHILAPGKNIFQRKSSCMQS